MTIQINNFDDLLEFIKSDGITATQATEIVCKALNVVCVFDMAKDEVIKATSYYINTFCKNNNSERPIFLNQMSLEFNIKDVW